MQSFYDLGALFLWKKVFRISKLILFSQVKVKLKLYNH